MIFFADSMYKLVSIFKFIFQRFIDSFFAENLLFEITFVYCFHADDFYFNLNHIKTTTMVFITIKPSKENADNFHGRIMYGTKKLKTSLIA